MLEAKNLSVFYGRHQALENVSVQVDRGEICVILGANGAGKSTLLSAVAGLTRCQAGGSVSVNGTDITLTKPSRIVEHGISLVPESEAIFGGLTVAENLGLGAFPSRARKHEAANLKRVYKLFPALSERRRQIARTMSGGEQKMLAVGRALMSDPDILMLDEPSLGLSPLLSTELFKALSEIGKSGVGILLVEQNANQSLKIADRGYLLENGHIVGEDSAVALANDPGVRRAYLGDADVKGTAPAKAQLPPAPPLAGKTASEMSALASELAANASAVQAAHIRSMRSAVPTPTASGGHEREGVRRPTVSPPGGISDAALALSRMAEKLAERAASIHAAHIRNQREQRAAPSQPAPDAGLRPSSGTDRLSQPATDVSALTKMAEQLAKQAAGRAHQDLNGGHPGRGEEPSATQSGNGATPEQAPALSASTEELAERAAAIHASHVAAIRSPRVTPHVFQTAGNPGNDDTAFTRMKKHKNDKKKLRKSRKRCGRSKGD